VDRLREDPQADIAGRVDEAIPACAVHHYYRAF
jgi:hypothetical protein